MNDEIKRHALSFGPVADAYDRARPSYPDDAARWLTSEGRPDERLSVLELGAGTGLLTQTLVAQGHRVVATDPSPEMLGRLRERVTPYSVGVSGAEAIPAPDRSIDVVVCAQSFHWFDHERALPEIARVLRPGGYLAMVWNQRDESIPWVRRLGALIDREGRDMDLVAPVRSSTLFADVEEQTFRCWQDLRKEGLLDLVRSRSAIATLDEDARTERLARVAEMYDDLGRGAAGLRLPYVTLCYRAQVIHPPEPAPRPEVEMTEDGPTTVADQPSASEATEPKQPEPPEDPGHLLIDFR